MHPPSTPEYYHRILNIDISNKCRLQCPMCDRTLDPSMIKRAKDITIESYQKLVDTFDNIVMSGQISDPIYHPKFHELIRMSSPLKHLGIATNGSGKRDSWWDEAFQIGIDNNNTLWKFALDGLPHESHLYRVHQDGNAVWEVMKKGKAMGANIMWQYIPFSYNEDHINEAAKMAANEGIEFQLKISGRHPEGMEPLNPKLRMDVEYVED